MGRRYQRMDRPDFSEKTQTEVARACHMTIWTGKDYPTQNSSRMEGGGGGVGGGETKRQTEETMGRQPQRVDWPCTKHHTAKSENREEGRK